MSSDTINPMMVKMKPTLRIYPFNDLPPETSAATTLSILGAVVADRFDRATFHRFLAKAFFFGRFRLLVDVGMAAVVVTFEVRGRGLATQIAVDALLIDIEFPGSIFRIFVRNVGHNLPHG